MDTRYLVNNPYWGEKKETHVQQTGRMSAVGLKNDDKKKTFSVHGVMVLITSLLGDA